MRPVRVLELRSVWGTGGGPEKTIILGAARSDHSRYAVTVCYIRDDRDEVFGVADRLASSTIDYVEVRERNSFDPAIWGKLKRIVSERQIDIVHAHDYKTDVLTLALAWRLGVVPLSTVHGWTGHSRRERWLYYPADKRVLAMFPRLVAVSSDIKNELLRYGCRSERIDTILNGIDHEAFVRDRSRERAAREALDLPHDGIVIGSVGRAEPQKRFDILIRAFRDVRRDNPGCTLVIAGDGGQLPQLRRLVAELGLAGSVRLLGHRNDVPVVHHALDLFVQASDYEGTPNAVLEAMAFETPTIATDAGGTAELVRDGVDGLIVAKGDVAGLARAISGAVADCGARRRWAQSARQRIESDLSFASRMKRLESVYDALMRGRTLRASQGKATYQ